MNERVLMKPFGAMERCTSSCRLDFGGNPIMIGTQEFLKYSLFTIAVPTDSQE